MCTDYTIGLAALVLACAPNPVRAQSTPVTLGDVRSVRTVAGGVLLRADHGSMLVQSIAGVGVRVRVRFGGAESARFPDPHSLATGDTAPPLGRATVRDAGDTVVILTPDGTQARVARHPLRLEVRDASGGVLLRESFGAAVVDGKLTHSVMDAAGTRYFGLGEQPTGLARNGAVFNFWNTDRYAYEPGQTIYATMPFYVGVRDGAAHGVLYDNPFRGEMDFAGRLQGSITYEADGGIDGGELRWYVIAGPGLDSVLARYTRLTGRMPLPPRWALAYQQSRYSYAPDSVLMTVAREFRRRDIPADVLYLDIGYMKGYRVFTWDPVGFPHPKALLDTLGAMGFKIVTIVDPGVKVDSMYAMYTEGMARHAFVTTPDGHPAHGTVWPGTAVFPDFSRAAVRQWWGDAQRALLDVGVRGIWNDMNEPSSFTGGTLSDLVRFDDEGRPGSHLEYHNQYGMLMARASYEGQRRLRPDARPFVVTRAGYTGVQRYSSMWTGDNRSTFAHLRLSIPMVLSLGLSGEPFAGSDIGGFAGAPSAELYARWLQSAALLPFFRTHSSIDVPRREPWSYGPDYEGANRATIRLRYRFLPELYTAFDQHLRTGAPVVRPVFWNALSDTVALSVDDEYLLGDNLLVAPVVDSAADGRRVYLPAGRWYRIGDDSMYTGGQRVTVRAPRVSSAPSDTTALQGLPIFVRAGAAIVTQPVMSYVGARVIDTLIVDIWPPRNAPVVSELYEDQGDGYGYAHGEYRRTAFTVTRAGTGVDVALARTGSRPGARTFSVTVHDLPARSVVQVDGRAIPVQYDALRRTARVIISDTARNLTVR